MSWIPPIDPEILEASDQMVKAQKRQARRQWLFEHLFDLIDLVIALVALVIAIFGLHLP